MRLAVSESRSPHSAPFACRQVTSVPSSLAFEGRAWERRDLDGDRVLRGRLIYDDEARSGAVV